MSGFRCLVFIISPHPHRTFYSFFAWKCKQRTLNGLWIFILTKALSDIYLAPNLIIITSCSTFLETFNMAHILPDFSASVLLWLCLWFIQPPRKHQNFFPLQFHKIRCLIYWMSLQLNQRTNINLIYLYCWNVTYRQIAYNPHCLILYWTCSFSIESLTSTCVWSTCIPSFHLETRSLFSTIYIFAFVAISFRSSNSPRSMQTARNLVLWNYKQFWLFLKKKYYYNL